MAVTEDDIANPTFNRTIYRLPPVAPWAQERLLLAGWLAGLAGWLAGWSLPVRDKLLPLQKPLLQLAGWLDWLGAGWLTWVGSFLPRSKGQAAAPFETFAPSWLPDRGP